MNRVLADRERRSRTVTERTCEDGIAALFFSGRKLTECVVWG